MPYSIPSSTKILTLATAPFLFNLVGVLSSVCEFAKVPGVYTLVCPRIKRYTLPPLIKKLECKDPQIYSKMLGKICKTEL